MSRAVHLAAALAALAAGPVLAGNVQQDVEAENARRAKAGLLPRKAPAQKPAAKAPPPAAAAPAPEASPAPVAAPPQAPAAPSPSARATVSAPVPEASPSPPPAATAAVPVPLAGPPPARPAPGPRTGALDVAVGAARGLAGGVTAASPLSIESLPSTLRGLTVTSTVRVRAGDVSLLVEPARR